MTAKMYQFPDGLGGGVHQALTEYSSKAGDDWRLRFVLPNIGLVDVPASALVEVPPPLPPEPPVESVVLVGGEAAQRFEDNPNYPGTPWAGVGSGQRYSWAQLCTLGGWHGDPVVAPVLLVPAPEPVELPWTTRDTDDYNVEVDASDKQVYVTASAAYMTPDQAREMARALWTAADAAEAQS